MDNPVKTVKFPNPEHPITIELYTGRVIVTASGRVIADSSRALSLREATYPAVYYIPREDVDISRLEPTDHSTYCPYKGDCSYYSIVGGTANAVWTYTSPYDAVAQIKDHLAFYSDRVDSIALV